MRVPPESVSYITFTQRIFRQNYTYSKDFQAELHAT